MSDSQRRDRYGGTGRHRFADPLRYEVMTAPILKVYDQVLAVQRMGHYRR